MAEPNFDSDAGARPVKLDPIGCAAAADVISGGGMQRLVLIVLTLTAMLLQAHAENRPTRFWNLTLYAISELYLAPAGTASFGPNQTNNDKDGTVDPDERLRITGVEPGTYDARLTDVSGRSCVVRNIKVEAGAIFSIEEKDLTACKP
jgi:hypothetical protein